MQKTAPTPGRLLTMIVFALSCFGLLLFLWLSFGGNVPLQPKGYRFTADFRSAVSLSEQADVRISGVNVGKVVKLTRSTGSTRAVIQLEPDYAPLPRDSRAVLRSKTLLGEAYVALSPGSADGPKIPEGGALPVKNVEQQVELDEVLRAFDPPTRKALHDWMAGTATALDGRSRDMSDALGNVAPTVEQGTDVLAILDAQKGAVRRLVHDTGQVFGAIGEREGEVRTLISAGDRLFAETARKREALSATIAALPPFLAQTRSTLTVAQATAADAAPVLRDLKPVAPLVEPTLRDLGALAPDAKRLFERLDPVITASKPALPAATRLLRSAQPLVQQLLPLSQDLVPVVQFLGLQKDQVMASIANIASVLNAGEAQPNGTSIPYLRAITYFSQEGFIGTNKRFSSNRRQPFLRNRGLDALASGGPIKASDCDNLDNPEGIPPADPPPPCEKQGPMAPEFGLTVYPHLERDRP